MTDSIFDDIKRYIAFGEQDAVNLRSLGPHVRPAFGTVVERFYEEILRSPGARAVLTGGNEQVTDLKVTLRKWLGSLFAGEYGREYRDRHAEIGRVHVRVGLPQHYMFTGMEIVWQELSGAVRAAGVPGAEDKLVSLHKLLTLEIGIMLETYKESYSSHVREKERSRMQDKLTRAEHLAEIGSLAASIAHEVKNPLAGISGAVQVIRDGMRPDDPHRPIIGEIMFQIDRLDSAVKDLLLYARPHPPRMKSCDPGEAIKRVLTVLREEPDMQTVRVEFTSGDNVPYVQADEQQIEQVLMNLLLNAAQASGDSDAVYVSTVRDGDTVKVVVRDHGCGITEQVSKRMFEPFFTTKAKGTGLGLPICRKIIDAHHGDIAIRSVPAEGTTVTVELPIHPGDDEFVLHS